MPEKPPRAVEEVLDAFYRAIGTPAPAPGIERLAFIATEAARNALREEWESEGEGEGFRLILARCNAYEAALREIVSRPTVERNPDGVDQAAHTMQLVARAVLGATQSD